MDHRQVASAAESVSFLHASARPSAQMVTLKITYGKKYMKTPVYILNNEGTALIAGSGARECTLSILLLSD